MCVNCISIKQGVGQLGQYGYTAVVTQSLSCVQLFVTPWAAEHQVPLSYTISWNSLKFVSIELVI